MGSHQLGFWLKLGYDKRVNSAQFQAKLPNGAEPGNKGDGGCLGQMRIILAQTG